MVLKKDQIAVVYLARGCGDREIKSYQKFKLSYQSFRPSGHHNMYVVIKGATALERERIINIFADVNPNYLDVEDKDYDIGSYAHTARVLTEEFLCFFNTYSEIMAKNWLEILFHHLVRPGVGMVGCTGSYESLDYLGLESDGFPNPHIRTNGFIIRREHFLELTDHLNIRNKFDAYGYESGRLSFTARLAKLGLKSYLAGRNGRAYPPDAWHVSDTFRQGTQNNLLVGDNQTRHFDEASPGEKLKLSRHAWGRFYNADDCFDPEIDAQNQQNCRLDTIISNVAGEHRVDSTWYLERYPDVAEAKVDAVEHYLNHGQSERRFPNEQVEELYRYAQNVDAEWYLSRYNDVAYSTFDAVEHYLVYGRNDGYYPNHETEQLHLLGNSVDEDWYLDRYKDVLSSNLGASDHFMSYGRYEGRFPNADFEKRHIAARSFDAAWYIARYPDVPRDAARAAEHFLNYGFAEGRAFCSSAEPRQNWQNAFDEEFYIAHHPEAESFEGGPLEHYLVIGILRGYAPNPDQESREKWLKVLDREWYLKAYEDVRVKGIDPLEHYIRYGIKERRKYSQARQHRGTPIGDLQINKIKTGAIKDEVVIFLVRAINGIISQYSLRFVEAMQDQGISVVLLISGHYSTDEENIAILNASDSVYVTAESAQNLEAFAHLLHSQVSLYECAVIYFATDNYIGPISKFSLSKALSRIRSSAESVIGLTESIEGGWHVQPDFFAVRTGAIDLETFKKFMLSIEWINNAAAHFQENVIGFARMLRSGAAKLKILFPSAGFVEREGFDTTIHRWKDLIDAGFPFLNIRVARGTEKGVQTKGWRELFAANGFDTTCVDATLARIFALEARCLSSPSPSKELLKLEARSRLHEFFASNETVDCPVSNTPELSVIIVVFNESYFSLQCLLSVVCATCVETEVLIVNNASTDDTDYLLKFVKNANVSNNIVDLHFLRAANEAISRARGRFVLFLNNDVKIHRDAIKYGLETLGAIDDCAAVGGKLVLPDGKLQEAGSIIWNDGTCSGYGRGDEPDGFAYNFRRAVDYCSGAYFLIRKNHLDEMQSFDPDFAPAYYEETDLCLRIASAGKKIIYDPRVFVEHYEFASAASGNEPSNMMLQNFELFARKNAAILKAHYFERSSSMLLARASGREVRRILMVDNLLPLCRYGAGFPRTQAMLEALVAGKFFVTYYPSHQAVISEDEFAKERLIDVEYVLGSRRPTLLDFLEERKGYYNALIVCRPNNVRAIQEIFARTPYLADAYPLIYDAEAIVAARDISRFQKSGRDVAQAEIDALIQKEVDLSSSAKATIVVNKNEASIFSAYGRSNVNVLGHSIKVNGGSSLFSERKNLLFVGRLAEDDSPNVHSLHWFAGEVLPHFDRLMPEDFQIVVVGMSDAPSLRKLPSHRFMFVGPQQNLSPFFSAARVFIAPTQYAAGIPIKIIEAAAHGLPAVVTELLDRQLKWPENSGYLNATVPKEFAKQCFRLYTDASLWLDVRDRGMSLVENKYSARDFRQRLSSIVSDVCG